MPDGKPTDNASVSIGGQSNLNPSRSNPARGPHQVNRGAVPALPYGTSLTPSRERQREDYSPLDAVRRIDKDSFLNFHKQPCVRQSLMTAIVVGFAAMGGLLVAGKSVAKASNWCVGTGVTTSILAMGYCQNQRSKEIKLAQQVVDVMEKKKAARAKQMREAQEARRRAAKEEERRFEAERRAKQWWRVW